MFTTCVTEINGWCFAECRLHSFAFTYRLKVGLHQEVRRAFISYSSYDEYRSGAIYGNLCMGEIPEMFEKGPVPHTFSPQTIRKPYLQIYIMYYGWSWASDFSCSHPFKAGLPWNLTIPVLKSQGIKFNVHHGTHTALKNIKISLRNDQFLWFYCRCVSE